ncbi:MAG: sodium/proline symporter [Chloroflexi bacterium]|nr:sodium/proline symporter [Chloroflexota bacterium]
MPANAYWILCVFIAYFVVLIGIAIVRSRHMDDMSDYVLGGRKMGLITSGLSAASSAASGWTMLVLPALAFAAGMMHLWTVASIILGHWFAWTIMARRIRRYSIAADNSLTLPEFLEKRFGDTSGALRTLSGLIGIYFITLYVCSGLIAGAKLLEVVFGLDDTGQGHNIGVIISLIAVVSYTFIGGFLAVSRTDVFQSLIMLAGFIIIPVTLILTVNNPFQGLESTAPGFWDPFTDQGNTKLGFLFFISSVGWGLGALGAHRIISRFMAVQRESDIRRSRNVGAVWVVLIFLFALLMGLVAAPALLDRGIVLPDAEKLYIVVAETFFHPVVAGLLLTAVIAAVMSTADSQLLLASAIATDDLPIIKRITYAMRTQYRVWMGRGMLLLVGIIAAAISIVSPESVFALVSLAWGGMGAAFGPALILGLYWRRFNRWGALAAVVSGTVVSTWWWLMGLGYEGAETLTDLLGFHATIELMGEVGLWQINPGVPGFAVAAVFGVATALLTAPPPEEVTELYDHVNGPDWTEDSEAALTGQA